MEQRKESYTSIKNKYGIRYLGSTISSQKVVKSLKKGVMTYIIYIAPSDISGYKVCPNDTYCKDLCLNSSGQRKLEMWSNKNTIGNARIKKAKMFYENRADFMALLIHEIEYYSEKAKKEGLDFAVRLNGTSDLSPIIFKHDGKSILDIFPNIQFYDYTKVIGRLNIPKRHSNYDLTYSFNGYNWEECKQALENNVRVAVVFENSLPQTFNGYKVINGDLSDIRFKDEKNVIVGLKFKRTANSYKDGKYVGVGDTQFVIKGNDSRCEY